MLTRQQCPMSRRDANAIAVVSNAAYPQPFSVPPPSAGCRRGASPWQTQQGQGTRGRLRSSRCRRWPGCCHGRRPACWRKWPIWTAPVRTAPAGMCSRVPCSATIQHGSALSTACCCTPPARRESARPGLPDFLGLEGGGELALLGQEELDISVLEAGLREQMSGHSGTSVSSELETERILLAAARVGQHVFARQVLANCGSTCVFCGLRPRRSAAPGCCWQGTSSHGRTAHPASASIPATAWLPVRRMMWPSTPACSRSTGDCASMLPAHWPTPQRLIRSPGSTTGGRRCVR